MSRKALLLDDIAKRYGKLPADLLDRPIGKLQIDLICLQVGNAEEIRQIKLSQQKMKHKGKNKRAG